MHSYFRDVAHRSHNLADALNALHTLAAANGYTTAMYAGSYRTHSAHDHAQSPPAGTGSAAPREYLLGPQIRPARLTAMSVLCQRRRVTRACSSGVHCEYDTVAHACPLPVTSATSSSRYYPSGRIAGCAFRVTNPHCLAGICACADSFHSCGVVCIYYCRLRMAGWLYRTTATAPHSDTVVTAPR